MQRQSITTILVGLESSSRLTTRKMEWYMGTYTYETCCSRLRSFIPSEDIFECHRVCVDVGSACSNRVYSWCRFLAAGQNYWNASFVHGTCTCTLILQI